MNKIAVLLMFLALASLAWAATFTMGFPPPGGVNFVSADPTGAASGNSGGQTFFFSNFNTASYNQLYWGLNVSANVWEGTGTGNMTFLSYNSSTGIATWGSTANWVFTSGTNPGCCSTPTQLMVQLQPYTGSPNGFLASGFLSPSNTKGALGVSGDPNEPLFQVVNGGSYQATFELATWDGNPADAGDPNTSSPIFVYNSGNNGGPGVNSSVDFEFWWSYKTTTAKTVQVGTCKTNLQSYPNISAAVSAVTAGATVDVCPGTYPEQVTITTPITLTGVTSGNNSAAIITVPGGGLLQNGVGPNTGGDAAQIVVQDVGPVTIKNLIIDGSSTSCPSTSFMEGIAFLSNAGTAYGKVTSTSVRNVNSNNCSVASIGILGEAGASFPLTVQGNVVHSVNGSGVIFAFGQTGTILGNTINGANSAITLYSPGSGVKVTSNAVSNSAGGISIASASSAIVQTNTLTSLSGQALQLNESGGGGSNNVTKNTVNDANCGISNSQAAGSDVYLPNTLLNTASNLCP